MMKGKKLAAKVLLGILLAAPYGAAAQDSIDESKTSSDAIDIVADKNTQSGIMYGIRASSDDVNNPVDITLTGDSISVKSETADYHSYAVWAGTNGAITLGNEAAQITVNAAATGSGKYAAGLLANVGKINVTADTLNVSATSEFDGRAISVQQGGIIDITANTVNASAASKQKAHGIYAHTGGTIDITANTVNATANSVNGTGEGKHIAVIAYGENSAVNIKTTALNATATGTGEYVRAFEADSGAKIDIEATDSVYAKGNEGVIFSHGKDDSGKGSVLNIKTGTLTAEGTNCVIDVLNGTNIASDAENYPENPAELTIEADTITVNADETALSATSNGQLKVDGDLTVNAQQAILTRGNSTININTDGAHKTVLNGDIVFEANSNSANALERINAYVDINFSGEGSEFNGSVYKTSWLDNYQSHIIDAITDDMSNAYTQHGDVTGLKLTFAKGAQWYMQESSFVNTLTVEDGGEVVMQSGAEKFIADEIAMAEGEFTMAGTEQTATVAALSGSGTVNLGSSSSTMSIADAEKVTALTVAATPAYAAQLAQGDLRTGLQAVADQVTKKFGEVEISAATNVALEESTVLGYTTAGVDEYGNVIWSTYNEAPNTTNAKIGSLANIAYMAWRAENNDMNKRLGELRDSKGEHGIWARMVRGESEYKSIKNQYNTYQLGYDEKLSTNDKWTLGGAVTYTDGESSFAGGNGENTHTGFALYGSYLNDDGSFIDLIAKYARLEHDYEVSAGAGSGSFEANGYSVSAEYGKRFTQDNGFWIEPQVELTYGKVGSADFVTESGVKVRQDGMESLVGRLGFALGKNFKQGNAYVRASYLYDFEGETAISFTDGATRSFEDDLGGGWWEVGVGTNINLSDATHLYFDVEKTYGGDVATPWQWNLGVRYSF